MEPPEKSGTPQVSLHFPCPSPHRSICRGHPGAPSVSPRAHPALSGKALLTFIHPPGIFHPSDSSQGSDVASLSTLWPPAPAPPRPSGPGFLSQPCVAPSALRSVFQRMAYCWRHPQLESTLRALHLAVGQPCPRTGDEGQSGLVAWELAGPQTDGPLGASGNPGGAKEQAVTVAQATTFLLPTPARGQSDSALGAGFPPRAPRVLLLPPAGQPAGSSCLPGPGPAFLRRHPQTRVQTLGPGLLSIHLQLCSLGDVAQPL